jgi:hypothetical protein
MIAPVKYYGTYTDDWGATAIVIENDFENLHVEIDGVQFKGAEFSDMELVNRSNYTEKELERFTFWPTPMFHTDTNEQSLCNCSFEFPIGQLIIDTTTHLEISGTLTIKCTLGTERPQPKGGLAFEEVRLRLSTQQFDFEGEGDCFEVALDKIQHQFEGRYRFKNCYGCMYGDYSVYGQSSFGTMLCFVKQKDQYKKAKNKQEYLELAGDYQQVQEIYCCDQYEIRTAGAGYRG